MRRDFIISLTGAAAAWPLTARAQQPEKIPRIGVLSSLGRGDAVGQDWDAAFRKQLDELGLVDCRTILTGYRWGDSSVDRIHVLAGELIQLKQLVLVAMATPAAAALQDANPHLPNCICGRIRSGRQRLRCQPGEIRRQDDGLCRHRRLAGRQMGGMMHRIAPAVSRLGFLFNPQRAPFAEYYLETFRSAATTPKIDPIEAPVHSTAELDAAMSKFGREGGTGLIAMPENLLGKLW